MDCGLDGLTFDQPSLVKPQFAEDADIGNIVQRFMKTGQLPAFTERPTIDSTEGLPASYEELMQNVVLARQHFDALPLEERNKFNNNPELWLESLAHETNDSESSQVEETSAPSSEEESLRTETSSNNETSQNELV